MNARASAFAALAMSAVLMSSSSSGGGGRSSAPEVQSFMFAASDAYDDGLMIANQGAMIFLPNQSHSAGKSDGLKFDTDDCGLLVSVRNRHSMVTKSELGDDWDDPDEDDPSLAGQAVIGRWLSSHPEIAVVTDGIDKWCGDFSLVGENLSSEFEASWSSQSVHGGTGLKTILRPAISYIS